MKNVVTPKPQKFVRVVHTHWAAILVGVLFLLLSLVYNVSNPLWESDSEWSHYQHIRYIIEHRTLPNTTSSILVPETLDQCQALIQPREVIPNQFRQPPLYYLLAAAATGWVPIEQELPVSNNPHLFISHAQGGYNIAVHSAAESFPYRGTVLAVHLARLLSGLIGLAGLIAVYLTGLIIFPSRRHLAVAVMATSAFIPQYVFSSAVVNNDILAGSLGSWCIFLCVRMVLHRGRPVALAPIALVASLALLAKYSSLALVPIVGATFLVSQIQVWRDGGKQLQSQLWKTILVVGLACLPALLWLGRNRLVYGHFFGSYSDVTDSFVQDVMLNPIRVGDNPVLDPLHAARFVFMTFWGLFGNDVLALPQWVLLILAGACLVALIGLLLILIDKRQPSQLRMLIVAALLFIGSALLINLIKGAGTSEPRGRYLLPVYSIVSFLLVTGIYRVLPRSLRDRGVFILPTFLFVLSAAIPFLLFRPVYAPPAVTDTADLLPGEQPVHATFGDFAELVGYRIEPERLGLFENARVTLVWRALRSTSNNYSVGVHLLDGANVSQGTIARFPGRGNFATSLWQPGDVFRDTYDVVLRSSARDHLPSLGRIKVALYCYAPIVEAETYLPVTDSQGRALGDTVYLGRLKLAAAADGAGNSSQSTSMLYQFGDKIGVEDFSVTSERLLNGQKEMLIELRLQALARPALDYVVFAHLVDGTGNQVAGNDQPLTDNYYPSGLWDKGERVVHKHRLPIPPDLPRGTYSLRMGLYDPLSGARLAVRDAEGVEQAGAEIDMSAYQVVSYPRFLPYVVVDLPPVR